MDLVDFASSPLVLYAVVSLLVAIDAVVPAVPAETTVIAAGALAGAGHLQPLPLALAAVAGAFAGDHLAYAVGRGVLRRPIDRIMRGKRGRRVRDWAATRIRRHGMSTIVVARFIPGGRTAATTVAGWLRYPLARFAPAVVTGGAAWAAYGVALGFVAGEHVPGPLWQRVLIGVAVGLALSAWIAAIQRVIAVRRRLSRPASGEEPAPSPASQRGVLPPARESAPRDPQTSESSR